MADKTDQVIYTQRDLELAREQGRLETRVSTVERSLEKGDARFLAIERQLDSVKARLYVITGILVAVNFAAPFAIKLIWG